MFEPLISNAVPRFPDCDELLRQSPINIITSSVDHRTNSPLRWSCGYLKVPCEMYLRNNYKTIRLSVPFSERLYVTSKLLYCTRYYFKHINFHWADCKKEHGSEHWIDGKSYAVEMQAVHFQYTSAYLQKYLIISYFFELKKMYYWGLKKFLEPAAKCIKQPNTKIAIPPFALKELLYTLPFSYYTYNGSSTIPPYDENVKWIICAKPLPISILQIRIFKEFSKKDKRLRNNNRRIQDNNQVVTFVDNPSNIVLPF